MLPTSNPPPKSIKPLLTFKIKFLFMQFFKLFSSLLLFLMNIFRKITGMPKKVQDSSRKATNGVAASPGTQKRPSTRSSVNMENSKPKSTNSGLVILTESEKKEAMNSAPLVQNQTDKKEPANYGLANPTKLEKKQPVNSTQAQTDKKKPTNYGLANPIKLEKKQPVNSTQAQTDKKEPANYGLANPIKLEKKEPVNSTQTQTDKKEPAKSGLANQTELVKKEPVNSEPSKQTRSVKKETEILNPEASSSKSVSAKEKGKAKVEETQELGKGKEVVERQEPKAEPVIKYHLRWNGTIYDEVTKEEEKVCSCIICEHNLSSSPVVEEDGNGNEDEYGYYFETANLPEVGMLGCGHCYHTQCLESITPDDLITDPPCLVCLS